MSHYSDSPSHRRSGRALLWPLLALLIASPLALASYWQGNPQTSPEQPLEEETELKLGQFPQPADADPPKPEPEPTPELAEPPKPSASETPAESTTSQQPEKSDTSEVSEADAALAERALGTWNVHHYGNRVLTLKPDGIATMKVTLDLIPSMLYGEKLDFNLKWTIKDGVMTHTMVSGTPKANVDKLIKDYGDSMSYMVMEITDEHILLRSESDGETLYDWKAVDNSDR